MNPIDLISVHGGHSAEYCCHASDSLQEVIEAYIESGFSWVGITEHIPPLSDDFLYPLEIEMGWNAKSMYERFANYIAKCREYQEIYKDKIDIYVAFETEAYSGYQQYIKQLTQDFNPDYIVGSVHHVNNVDFDSDEKAYNKAIEAAGSIDELYNQYFDLQLEMIKALKPAVVGHFDLIRLYDPDYKKRIQNREIEMRINRNLEVIKDLGLILDHNVKALRLGGNEPYISEAILEKAIAMKIKIVPGDDSHGVNDVGVGLEEGLRILRNKGANTDWNRPISITQIA